MGCFPWWSYGWLGNMTLFLCPASRGSLILHIASLGKEQNSKYNFYWICIGLHYCKVKKIGSWTIVSWRLPYIANGLKTWGFFKNFILYWNIADEQSCDSFSLTAKVLGHSYTCIHFPPNPPPMQAATKYWTEFPVWQSRSFCWLAILNTCQSQSLSLSPHGLPWQP